MIQTMLDDLCRDGCDRLDAGQEPGLLLKLLLFLSPECRKEIARSEEALAACHRTVSAEPDGAEPDDLEKRIMGHIMLLPAPKRPVGIWEWIIAGAVIGASVALIPFGDEFAALGLLFGARYTMPLMLILGLVVTAYCAVFIATHMDELEAFFRRRPQTHGLHHWF